MEAAVTRDLTIPRQPRQLLLATDLSPRCDRALDRAAQLSTQWQAGLMALHVLDPSASADHLLAWVGRANEQQLMQHARRQLVQDLRGMVPDFQLRIERRTQASDAIARAAAESRAELVITGVSRDEALGRFSLGSTVESLSRTLTQALLVVRRRVHGAYRRIVVATDFSDSSRLALQTAAALFADAELIVYHACSVPMAGLVDGLEPGRLSRQAQQEEMAAFMQATPLPGATKVRSWIEFGPVEQVLGQYVRAHEVDLVVAGSHGRTAVWQVLLGSTAGKLLRWLPCDTLLVPDPRART